MAEMISAAASCEPLNAWATAGLLGVVVLLSMVVGAIMASR